MSDTDRQPDAGERATPVYRTARIISHVLLTILYGLRRHGIEHVPERGPLLLVSNHESFLDPPIIGVSIPHRVMHSMARAGLFEWPILGFLIRRMHTISIEEQGGDIAAMKKAIGALKEGEVVLIFPEGSRTPDGRMHEFKRGVSVLLRRSRCPVAPVGVVGAFEAWPRFRRLPRLFGPRIAVRIGEPTPHDELLRDGPDEALRRLEREIAVIRADLRRELDVSTGRASIRRRLSGRDRARRQAPGAGGEGPASASG